MKGVGFRRALWLMAARLAVIFVAGLYLLPPQLGKAKSSKRCASCSQP